MRASESFAHERTQLAWRRTALAHIVFGLLAVKVAFTHESPILLAIAAITVCLAIANYAYSSAKIQNVAYAIGFQVCILVLLALVTATAIL